MARIVLAFVGFGLLAGCSSTPMGGGDASSDAGVTSDAGHDGAAIDTGVSDASTTDSGAHDAATPDSGTPDSGALDSGVHDSGPTDASAQDAGTDGGDPTSCPPGEHLCACATGHYCLFMGAACISPSSPCP